MIKQLNRKALVRKRHYRLRRTLIGYPTRPRLAVYRSNKHISVQIIDDISHKTLVSAGTYEPLFRKESSGANIEAAKRIGETIAKRALEKGISSVVFDRGGNLYHGRIAALAESAREAGLLF
ncbi:MAG: 50S ribosomal protein L18 [Candidatus Melainabacteria bacterium]|nr:50S ribosomal protein L18 [Candidatus Melainabacteria bacterium]